MTVTYEKIATTTASGGSTSVTLSSIPATYTDLVLVMAGSNSSPSDLRMRFNGDTGSNYSSTVMYGDGSSSPSFRESNQTSFYGAIGTGISNSIINIMNYSNTTTYKTVITRTNSNSFFTMAFAELWRSTSAINSVTCYVTSGSYNAGVTFTLYGIKAE
jgi:hypothetical protein